MGFRDSVTKMVAHCRKCRNVWVKDVFFCLSCLILTDLPLLAAHVSSTTESNKVNHVDLNTTQSNSGTCRTDIRRYCSYLEPSGRLWLFWLAWWRENRCTCPRPTAWHHWCWWSTPTRTHGPTRSCCPLKLDRETDGESSFDAVRYT